MKRRFQDSAVAPIIAFDFDETINVGGVGSYPECGKLRAYSRKVINLLNAIGVKVVIWTSRDTAYVQEEGKIYDDLTPMIGFLDKFDIHYDAINKSVQFSPWHVNSRKVYAHMYVDDRAFGWYEHDMVMIDVLREFLSKVVGMKLEDIATCVELVTDVTRNEFDLGTLTHMQDIVKNWRNN